MSVDSWIILLGVSVGLFCSWLNARAAYRNGVCDGYGFSQEPLNPGYKVAGDYLRQFMAHRWDIPAEQDAAILARKEGGKP